MPVLPGIREDTALTELLKYVCCIVVRFYSSSLTSLRTIENWISAAVWYLPFITAAAIEAPLSPSQRCCREFSRSIVTPRYCLSVQSGSAGCHQQHYSTSHEVLMLTVLICCLWVGQLLLGEEPHERQRGQRRRRQRRRRIQTSRAKATETTAGTAEAGGSVSGKGAVGTEEEAGATEAGATEVGVTEVGATEAGAMEEEEGGGGYIQGGGGGGGNGGGGYRQGGGGGGGGRGRGGRGWKFNVDVNSPPASEWASGLQQQPGRRGAISSQGSPFEDVPGGAAAATKGSDYSEGRSLLPMQRPGHGKEGRRVRLVANHFLVRDFRSHAVQYRVDFELTHDTRGGGLPGTTPPLPASPLPQSSPT